MRATALRGDNGMPNRNKENRNSKYYGKAMRTPALKASIVEPILICCINGISLNDLELEMQKATPLSTNNLKKYLLCLVDYHLILYNGQRHVYAIENDGFDLLDIIMKEKRAMNGNMKDLVITLE
jgi:hypothetical protein